METLRRSVLRLQQIQGINRSSSAGSSGGALKSVGGSVDIDEEKEGWFDAAKELDAALTPEVRFLCFPIFTHSFVPCFFFFFFFLTFD